ncbi:hypothetical protein MASR2M48_25090 [Spirochaetota bacterium]
MMMERNYIGERSERLDTRIDATTESLARFSEYIFSRDIDIVIDTAPDG